MEEPRESSDAAWMKRGLIPFVALPFVAAAMVVVYEPVGVALACIFALIIVGFWAYLIWAIVGGVIEGVRNWRHRSPKETMRREERPRYPRWATGAGNGARLRSMEEPRDSGIVEWQHASFWEKAYAWVVFGLAFAVICCLVVDWRVSLALLGVWTLIYLVPLLLARTVGRRWRRSPVEKPRRA